MPMLRQPIRRQRRPPTTVERYKVQPIAPGAEHYRCIGAPFRLPVLRIAFENDVESAVLKIEPSTELAVLENRGVLLFARAPLPVAESCGETNGLCAVQVDSPAGYEIELVSQPSQDRTFLLDLPNGHVISEQRD